MDYISILGIGVICRVGNTVDEIWNCLEETNDDLNDRTISKQCVFDLKLPNAKKRKMNRYSEMGVYTAMNSINNALVNFENVDKERVGTIFTTGYGPINSSMIFAKSVAKQDWECCSPTVFANSVNNTCVGHICMNLSLRGASTMFMGSNNLLYSQMIFGSKKADYIITGAIEEHCLELFEILKKENNKINVPFNEAAIAFLTKAGIDSQAYCIIEKIEECSIGNYPIIKEVANNIVEKRIKKLCNRVVGTNNVDAFFGTNNGNYFDNIENRAIKDILGDKILYIKNIKRIFGETLGSSFNLNIMVAALCIKNGYLPNKIDKKKTKVKRILVSGYDISGNYTLASVSEIRKEI